jgi:hypothetical protein
MHINRLRAAAAIAVAAVLAAGVVVIATRGHVSGGEHQQAATARRVPSASAAPARTGSPVVPVVDFSGVRWVDYHGVALPASAQAGPHDTAHGLASGYADTPLGALLAAVNIGVRTSWELGPAIFQPTIQQQVTGPFEADMLSADLDSYGQGGAQTAGTGADASEAGYLYVGYTPADATVDIVTEGAADDGSTVYAVTQIEVEWLGGDWNVVAPPGGDWGNDVVQVPSLDGYLLFPGQEG